MLSFNQWAINMSKFIKNLEDYILITEFSSFKEPDVTENYIRIRQKDPSLFQRDTFKTISLTSGIKAVVGKLKGETSTTIQTILFDKKRFSVSEAKMWAKKHKAKFSSAAKIENKKISLFHDMNIGDGEHSHSFFEEHLYGHLPPLSPSQIKRLLDFLGNPDPTEEDDYMTEEEYQTAQNNLY